MPQSAGETVYLALGSNLGDRLGFLAAAAHALAASEIELIAASAIYETDAVAAEPQPPYLNAVLRAETRLSPHELLATALAIEARLGRQRPAGLSRAPRTVDIDLLLHGRRVIDEPTLRIPHPALLERAFVRIPLRDVAAPDLCHPLTGERLDRAEASDGVRLQLPAARATALFLPVSTASV